MIPPDTSAVCKKCGFSSLQGNKGEIRYIYRVNPWSKKKHFDGPYDKACAYEVIHGNLPPFKTYPLTKQEYVYRLLFRSEIPKDAHLTNILSKFAIVVAVMSSALFVFVYLLATRLYFLLTYAFVVLLDIAGVLLILFALLTWDAIRDRDPDATFEVIEKLFSWLPKSYRSLGAQLFSPMNLMELSWPRFLAQLCVFIIYSLLLVSRITVRLIFSLLEIMTYFLVVYLITIFDFFFAITLGIPLMLVGRISPLIFHPLQAAKSLSQKLKRIHLIVPSIISYLINGLMHYFVLIPLKYITAPLKDASFATREIDFENIWENKKSSNELSVYIYLYQFLDVIALMLFLLLSQLKGNAVVNYYMEALKWIIIVIPGIALSAELIILLMIGRNELVEMWYGQWLNLIMHVFQIKPLRVSIAIAAFIIVLVGFDKVTKNIYKTHVVRYLPPPKDVIQTLEAKTRSPLILQDIGEKRKIRSRFLLRRVIAFGWAKKPKEMGLICEICKKELFQGIKCPHCDHAFHRNHLEEYVSFSKRSICPVCRNTISLTDSK